MDRALKHDHGRPRVYVDYPISPLEEVTTASILGLNFAALLSNWLYALVILAPFGQTWCQKTNQNNSNPIKSHASFMYP